MQSPLSLRSGSAALSVLVITLFYCFYDDWPAHWQRRCIDGHDECVSPDDPFRGTVARYGQVRPAAVFWRGSHSSSSSNSSHLDWRLLSPSREPGAVFVVAGQPGCSLFASLTGPRAERAACLLDEIRPAVYVCKVNANLPPGNWHLQVVLSRAPLGETEEDNHRDDAKDANPNATSLTKSALCSAGILAEKVVLPLHVYVERAHFATSPDLDNCFLSPRYAVLNGTFSVPEPLEFVNRSSLPLCRGRTGPGIWVPLANLSAPERQEAWNGGVLAGASNLDPIRHAFFPLGCRLRQLSDDEAVSCLSQKRPFLAGDSRLRALDQFLNDTFYMGMKNNSVLEYLWPLPRMGLIMFFPNMPGINLVNLSYIVTQYRERFTQAYSTNRVLAVNSLLHDLAPLRIGPVVDLNGTAENVRNLFGNDMCPDTCRGKLKGKCFRRCREKIAPVRRYLEHLEELLEDFPAKSDQTPIWMSVGKRPPSLRSDISGMQGHATLTAIQDAAMDIARQAGWQVLDFRDFEIGTLPDWWHDEAHWEVWREGGGLFNGTGRMRRVGMLPWIARILFDAIC